MVQQMYDRVVAVCSECEAYASHGYSVSKAGRQYLRVRTKAGQYFTREQTDAIDSLVTELAGTKRTISMNSARGTLNVTFYE